MVPNYVGSIGFSPEQIWNQLEYETEKNPIEKLFPLNCPTGRWNGSVHRGDEKFDGASVYPIKDATMSICNLAAFKFYDKKIDSYELALIQTETSKGCFILFDHHEHSGSDIKVYIVTSDLWIAAAMAYETSYPVCFALYPENTEDVAVNLAKAFPDSIVVIYEEQKNAFNKLPKNVCELPRPSIGMISKIIIHPEKVKQKIDKIVRNQKTKMAAFAFDATHYATNCHNALISADKFSEAWKDLTMFEFRQQAINQAAWKLSYGQDYLYDDDGVLNYHFWALHDLYQAANFGDRDAAYHFGKILMYGDKVEKDHALGVHYLLRASDMGESKAMVLLGKAYLNGNGTKTNPDLAAHWFQRAADLGESEAMMFVGKAHLDGDGSDESHYAALHWFRLAADLGQVDAQEFLSCLTLLNEGGLKTDQTSEK